MAEHDDDRDTAVARARSGGAVPAPDSEVLDAIAAGFEQLAAAIEVGLGEIADALRRVAKALGDRAAAPGGRHAGSRTVTFSGAASSGAIRVRASWRACETAHASQPGRELQVEITTTWRGSSASRSVSPEM
jgi:hypothetical protein